MLLQFGVLKYDQLYKLINEDNKKFCNEFQFQTYQSCLVA